MLDLEDAVAASEKAAARAIVCESALAAPAGGPLVGVRINSLAHRAHGRRPRRARRGAPAHRADHGADGRGPRRRRATSPAASTSSSARPASRRARSRLLAMTETARGVLAAREIAEASPRLRTLHVRARRPGQGSRHRAHGRGLRAPARALGDRARGARRRQGGADRRALPQARRRRGLRRLRRLGAAPRLPGQGRRCIRASCRSRPRRSRRASASWPGRARSTALSARPRPPASRRSSSPTGRSSTTRSRRAPATFLRARRPLNIAYCARMKVERIRKAYEQVADQLLQMINSGELKPGDRLPQRSRARGRLRRLAHDRPRGAADPRHAQPDPHPQGHGRRALHRRADRRQHQRVPRRQLRPADGRQHGHARAPAAGARDDRGPAAAIAARNRDDDDLEKIRASLSDDISAVSEADALAKFRNFHLYLLEATKNQLLVVAAAPIFTVLQSTIVRRRPTKEVIAEIELDHQQDLRGGRGPGRGRRRAG